MRMSEAYEKNIIPEEVYSAIGAHCKYCGFELVISGNLKRITCENEFCTRLIGNSIEYFLKSLGVRDFGPEVCFDLVEELELNYPYEVMALTEEEMPSRYSDSVKQRLWLQIQDANTQPIHKIIRALGLAGIDKSAEKIFGEINSYDDLEEFLTYLECGTDAEYDIAKFLGIGVGDRACDVLAEIVYNKDLILNAVSMFEIEQVRVISEDTRVVSIAITGGIKGWKNKELFVDSLNSKFENVFVKYNTTFNKNIDFLITDTPDPTSSKYKKATSNNIKILCSEDFESLLASY